MVWLEPQNHLTNCYFCAVKTAGLTSRTRSSIKYPNLPSAIQPVPHCDELPIPVFHGFYQSETESESKSSSEESDRCEEVVVSSHNDEPQLFTQAKLNDLVHDLYLPKSSAELLGSQLKEKTCWLLKRKSASTITGKQSS